MGEEKEKKDFEPEKEKEMETQDDTKDDRLRSNPGSVSKDEHLPHAPIRGADSLVETNPRQPEKKEGKETAEKMDSNTHTSAEDMKDNNEKEDKVEAALKTMQA